jgi:NADH:ubiquinone oxidoreductase subunit F (NADH-binding)
LDFLPLAPSEPSSSRHCASPISWPRHCREGTQWLSQIFRRIEHGKGRMEDIALLESLAKGMAPGKTICALADAAAIPTLAAVKHFKHELEEHVKLGKCPFQTGAQVAVPELAHAH